MKTNDTAVIILAAGGSTRMGQPKQLLIYNNESLLQSAVGRAVQIGGIKTFVVTGAKRELINAALSGYDAEIVENSAWEEGLSTSIVAGLSAALGQNADVRGCLFIVCDQPFLTTALLQEIIDASRDKGRGIVAAIYNNTPGTPVFFHKKYFPQLLALRGDEGARRLLRDYASDLITIPFADGAIDIDTPDDYKKLTHAD